jgi:DNA-binding transcriptional LysR family regulator
MLRVLEDALGFEVVSRSASGFTLTAAGRHASEAAARIVESLHGLKPRPNGSKDTYSRYVRLGSRGFLNAMIAPLVAARCERERPELGFCFVDLSPGEKLEAARREALDVLLSVEDLQLGRNWETVEVGHMTWGLFGACSHPLAGVAAALPEDLARHGVLRGAWWDGRSIVVGDDFVPVPETHKGRGYQVQTAHAALGVVARSEQLVYVPRLVAASAVERGQVAEIHLEGVDPVSQPLYLSVSKDRVEKFLQKILLEVVGEML